MAKRLLWMMAQWVVHIIMETWACMFVYAPHVTWGPEEAKWVTQMEMSEPGGSLRFPANGADVEPTTRLFFAPKRPLSRADSVGEWDTCFYWGQVSATCWVVDDDEAHANRVKLRWKRRLHTNSFPLFFFFFFKIFFLHIWEIQSNIRVMICNWTFPNIEKENGYSPIYISFYFLIFLEFLTGS